MPKPGHSLRRPVRPLAAALQMLDQATLNVALDLTVGAYGVPQGKVVRPSLQMPVQLPDQGRNRLKALTTIRHLMQLPPLLPDRLLRREHIQVFPIASFAVAVVPERVSQKVQARPLFPQV